MYIYLLEDDIRVQKFIFDGLLSLGHSVESSSTLEELENQLLNSSRPIKFDFILLDRMIGRTDSLIYFHKIKNLFPHTPIIILSALSDSLEKAKWLNLGVEDYLGKPFTLEELIARMSLISRRNKQITEDIENLPINIDEFKSHLTQKEFQILKLLSEKPGKIYSKNQILDIVWNVQFDIESNVVEVNIRHLREKTQNTPYKILSKRGVGYWIEI